MSCHQPSLLFVPLHSPALAEPLNPSAWTEEVRDSCMEIKIEWTKRAFDRRARVRTDLALVRGGV